MIDRAIKQIQGSNLDYRTSDFKAEIHFFGQIVGASNIQHDEGLFVEAFFEHGEKWKCLSPNNPLQTQTGYMNVENFICFSHPFDLHYTAESVYGWPKMIARVWKLDDTNKIDLVSYGCASLPNSTGFHSIKFDTWMLQGNLNQETLSFFLNTRPMMNTSDPVASNTENRKMLVTKPGPTIHLSFEVIFRNFSFHSLTGVDVARDK